jgi:N-glycosylase/DNA lyase
MPKRWMKPTPLSTRAEQASDAAFMIVLNTPADFRFHATILSHGWCQLPPFSYQSTDSIWLRRVERLAPDLLVELHIEASADGLHITSDQPLNAEQEAEARALVSRCLCLDQDMQAFYTFLRDHPAFAWVAANGAGRLLRAPTVWEDLAKTLLTTNTTWTMTRQMVARLAAMGPAHSDGHAFPTPQEIAALSEEVLNEQVRAGYRGAYLHELATRIAEGKVDVEGWLDSDLPSAELYKQIRGLKGFGDYAVGSVMRLLGRHDYLSIDSVARDMFRRKHASGENLPDSAIRAHYEPFGAWRGLVMWMDVIAEDYSV